MKQYLVVLAFLFLALRPKRAGVLLGVAIVVATAGPFLIWNPVGAIENGWLFVVRDTTFREDALSVPASV